MDPVESHPQIMENVTIPKAVKRDPLLRGLSEGDRRYMFSIISVYNPEPDRRRLYHKHKLLCENVLPH